MTLQAGDKLMSLTDVSEMLVIPVHIPSRGCRGLAGTAGRPTLVSAGQEFSPRAVHKALKPRAEPILAGRDPSTQSAPVGRFLRPTKMSAGGWP
jgi:hypothetical protein